VENSDVLERVDFLKNTPAHLKFLSCEPLLGPLTDLNVYGIDWVIVGGESGRTPRSVQGRMDCGDSKKCQARRGSILF